MRSNNKKTADSAAANPSNKSAADSAASESQPWYADGLKFKCSGCGDCCTGAPGYVWINEEEIAALAEAIEMTVDEFEYDFIRKIGARKSLKEFPNGDCVFFDGANRNCNVYGYRPSQCKTWPFWDSNLESPETWAETCEGCKGSGVGKLYSLEEIEEQRKVVKV